MPTPETNNPAVRALTFLQNESRRHTTILERIRELVARGRGTEEAGITTDAGPLSVGPAQDRFRALKSNLEAQEIQTRTRLGRVLWEAIDAVERHAVAAAAAGAALMGLIRAASPQTFDAFTTSAKILFTVVGASLVPALVEFSTWLLAASEFFGNLSPEVKSLVGSVGQAVILIGGAAGFTFALKLAIVALTKLNVTVGLLVVAARMLQNHFDMISESQRFQQEAMKNRPEVVRLQAEQEVLTARQALAEGKSKEDVLADLEERLAEAGREAFRAAKEQREELERGTNFLGGRFGESASEVEARRRALAIRVQETSERQAALRLARTEIEAQLAKARPFEGGPEVAELRRPAAGAAAPHQPPPPRPVRGRGDEGRGGDLDRLRNLVLASLAPKFNAGQFTAIGDLGRRAQAAAAGQTPLEAKLLQEQNKILKDMLGKSNETVEAIRGVRPAVGR